MTFVRFTILGVLAFSVAVGLGIPLAAAESSTARAHFMRAIEVRVGDSLPLPAWERVRPRLTEDEDKLKACLSALRCRDGTAARLTAFLSTLAPLGRDRQIAAVNDYFNRVSYVAEGFGQRDNWQAPLAFLRYAGDCEDYALAKYVSLRLLGVPEGDLRIVVGMDRKRGQAHAVLLVRLERDFLVLDNMEPLGPESRFTHFRPLYAVNGDSRWIFVADRDGQQVAATDRDGQQAAAAGRDVAPGTARFR